VQKVLEDLRRKEDADNKNIVLLDQIMADFPDFKCKLSHEIMRDPVTTSDDQTYERTQIERWFMECGARGSQYTSPLTNSYVTQILRPVRSLRGAIESAMKKVGAYFPE
jgi:hypothetical protein